MADNQTEFWRRVLYPPDAFGVNSLVEFDQGGVPPIGALVFPIGTTAQRPSSAVNGMMRYNTTLGDFEFFNSTWQVVSGVGGVSLSKMQDGDDDTRIFVENSTGVDDDTIAMTIGNNSGSFNVTANALTFSTAGFTIITPPAASGSTAGVDFMVATGAGNLAGRGGDVSFTAGAGGATGDGGDIGLTAGAGGVSGGGLAGTISLSAGDGGSAVPGGAITLTAGDGDSNVGGAVNIIAGTVTSGTGAGGAIALTAGASGGSSVGGAITLTAGTGSENTGGAVSIFSGDGLSGGAGGQFFVSAGDGDSAAVGGAVSISAGDGGASGVGGNVTIATGDGFEFTGSMTFNLGSTEGFTLEADGTLSVPVTTVSGGSYESLVTDDDDIPNKKFVDDAIIASPGLNNIVEDLTPQLGGTLDLNGQDIDDGTKIKWDSTNEQLAVGTNITTFVLDATTISPVLNTELLDISSPFNISMGVHSSTPSRGPRIVGYRSRGIDNSPGVGDIVLNGDKLVEIEGIGWDGVDYAEGGRIRLVVDGTPGANDMPGRWEFLTTPDGLENSVERLRIESDGTLSVQGTTAYEALLTDDDDIPNKKYVDDNLMLHQINGSMGAPVSAGIDIARIPNTDRPFTIVATGPHLASCDPTTTASVSGGTFDIFKASPAGSAPGAAVGTLTFAVATATAAVIVASPISVAVGDEIIIKYGVVDGGGTLANVGITLFITIP